MKNIRRVVLLMIAVTVLLSFSGCGGKKSDAVVVTGTVTVDSQPAEKVRVRLLPASGSGMIGFAVTDAAGKFAVQNPDDPELGVPPGEYKVTLSQTEAIKTGKMKENPGGEPFEIVNNKELLPKKYTAVSTTPLACTVTKEGPNDVTLNVE